jgi:type I restriction enzyme S subunit
VAAGKTTAMDVPEVVERVLGEGTFTVAKFAESFGALVEAAGGPQKLRSLVLELAVRGCLDAQSQIEPSPTTDATTDLADLPFALPPSWEWQSLGSLAVATDYGTSQKAHSEPSGIPVIRMNNIQDRRLDLNSLKYVPKSTDGLPALLLQSGDLLFNRTNSFELVGKMAVFREAEKFTFASYLIRVRLGNRAIPEYVNCYFGSLICRDRQIVPNITKQTNQANFNGTKLKAVMVPLPPLAEQKRIVARVDQLMALIDQLEAKENRKREVGARFTKASLEALTTAESPQEFTTAWTRIQSTWSTILDRADKVPGLRRLALDVATKGLLVPPKPGEDARNLLGQIGADVPQVAPEDAPFEIPSHWMWMRLGSLGAFVGGGTPSKNNSEFWKGNIPWVSPKDMKRLYIDDAEDHISAEAVDSSATKLIRSPSLLMVLRGMILAHSFPVALTTKTVTINQDMKALVLRVPAMAEFALLACRAARDRVLAKVQRSSHGTCRLESEDVANLPIPIPPLAEQKRIVAKVEHLMELCDVLEAALRRSEDRAAKLVEAVVQEMVA